MTHRADYLTDTTVDGIFSGLQDDGGENNGTEYEHNDYVEGSPSG